MKKILFLIMILFVMSGCADKKEEATIEVKKMDVNEKMPVKAIYGRRWIYGANYETEDPELIKALVEALKDVRIGAETDIMTTDSTDLIFLYFEDGSCDAYEFEAGNIVLDGKRYAVDGLGGVRLVLKAIAGED